LSEAHGFKDEINKIRKQSATKAIAIVLILAIKVELEYM
jgi:hypothetical protein